MNRLLIAAVAAPLLFSCSDNGDSVNKFRDDVIVHIYDLRDRRLADSLFMYLESENASYRAEAALAFGSIQDMTVVSRLTPLLTDDAAEVRKNTAFSLGQTGGVAAVTALEKLIASEQDPEVLNTAVEAYGKVAKPLALPSSINADALLGKAWSIYRAGLTGQAPENANATAASFLHASNEESVRLAGAHYFARVGKAIEPYFSVLSRAATSDESNEVRMATTLALGKIASDSALLVLESILDQSPDDRISVNAIRALQRMPFNKTKNYLLKALRNPRESIAIAASEAILATAQKDDWIQLANLAADVQQWRAQSNVYQAVLKWSDNEGVLKELKEIYSRSANPYQKASILTALQNAPTQISFLRQELMKADTPVVRTAAAAALVGINYHKDFKASQRPLMADAFMEALALKDPAVIASVASALQDSTLGYRKQLQEYSALKEARKSLQLPQDIETLQALERALAHFERRKPEQLQTNFNHPIDWALVKTIPHDQLAIIKTSKGNITIRLLVEEAPGSVANFVALARDNYFDNKPFHRVVPNFVIQGGCRRGDGSGSENYSIRSELTPRKYKTGSVGYASAGKDTEGTQWFICHSPTPHLDGRYTIFAEVEKGMEAVNMIQVGDVVTDVEILQSTTGN